jgi:hypothetical protein
MGPLIHPISTALLWDVSIPIPPLKTIKTHLKDRVNSVFNHQKNQ